MDIYFTSVDPISKNIRDTYHDMLECGFTPVAGTGNLYRGLSFEDITHIMRTLSKNILLCMADDDLEAIIGG